MSRKLSLATVAGCFALLLVAVGAFAAVTSGNTGWRWGNPLPQGNSLTSIEAAGTRVYAGGATGTLLRSDDAGATWSGVKTGLLDDVALVRAIGPDSVIFAAGCALRRSDDGGQTVSRLPWTPSDESCAPKIRSFHFPSGSIGYLLLENGDVFATGDAGQSWTKKTAVPGTTVTGGTGATGDIWFTADGTGVVSAGAQIYRTTDAASSWTLVSNTASADLKSFSFVNPNFGFVVGNGKNAQKTADGGATWTPVAVDAGTAGIDLRKIDCASPNDCIAAAANGSQLYRTSDGGTIWAAVSPSSDPIYDVAFASATRAVAIGGTGASVVSNDGGATWTPISSAVGGSFNALRAQSASTAYAYGDNGALARTTDAGNSWTAVGVSTSSRIVGVGFPSATRGYVVDDRGVLLRTSNGGSSWQFLNTGTGLRPKAITAPTDTSVVLVGPKGIRISTNSGEDFRFARGKNLKKVAFTALDHAVGSLFAYSPKVIWAAKSGGTAWKAFKKPKKAGRIDQLDMVSPAVGYLLDTKGELWNTRTAGRKWTRVDTTGTTFTQTIAFSDARHGYLTDGTGRILYTADAGKTWSRQYPFYDANGGSLTLIDAPSGTNAFMLIAGSNRLFATGTGGTNGVASALSLKSSAKRIRRNSTVTISGKLSPAVGGERISIVARLAGAKSGTRWLAQEVTVAANGTFSTRWRLKKAYVFTARWSGDAGHDGDGAKPLIVAIKKK
ncbi:MAG: YCF48-related protein [Solirubrobacterales bacterium]